MLIDQRGERRRRLHDQNGERVGTAARFEKALAQVEQVAARLHFAGAPQVGRIDGQRRERVCAGDDGVVGENRAELERKRVERLLEFVAGDQQRRRETGVVPRVDPDSAGAQVGWRQRVDDRERVSRQAPGARCPASAC